MAFKVLITAEAFTDLDSIAGFIKRQGTIHAARKWFAGIMTAIETLKQMPAHCPVASESGDIGSEVRILLHGRKERTYKIYYAIYYETPARGTVRVFHIRHWARKPLNKDELQDLIDD